MSFAAPKTAQQAPVVHDLLYLELGDPRCTPPSFTFKRTSMEGFTASRRRARLERCPLVRASPCQARARFVNPSDPYQKPIGQPGNHQKSSSHISEQSERQASCHKKLKFAVQTGRRLVLHSHASVRKLASIRQLCACKGDAGRRLSEPPSPDRPKEARPVD